MLCLLGIQPSKKDLGSPVLINAFQLIGMSSCLDFSGFFEQEVSHLNFSYFKDFPDPLYS